MNRLHVDRLGLLIVVAVVFPLFDQTARAQDARTPRVYDLLPLLHANSATDRQIVARGALLFGEEERYAAGPITFTGQQPGGPLDVMTHALEIPEASSLTIDGDQLSDVLASCLSGLFGVDYGEFELESADGGLRGKLTDREDTAALYLLQQLRDTTETLVEVECVLVTSGAWSELTSATKFEGSGRNEVFERALLDPRSRLLSAVGRTGQWISSGPLTRHWVHDDLEVNQTGVIPVLYPVVDHRWSGERMEVVPLRLRRTGKVFLDLAVAKYAVELHKTSFAGPWGELDSPLQKEQLLSTSLVVRPGEAVLAGELNAPDGLLALVRVNTPSSSPDPRAPQVGQRVLKVHETAPLFRIHRRSLEDPGQWERWDDKRIASRLQRRFDDVDAVVFTLKRLGDDLAVVATDEVHRWFDSMIDEELARLTRNVRIELEVLSVSRELHAELRRHRDDMTLLQDGWMESLRNKENVQRERYRVTGAIGQVHGLRNVAWETLMVGVQQVSGGTGFAIIEVADPTVEDGGSGVQLRLEATLSADDKEATLRLEGERARLIEKRAVSSRYPVLTAVRQEGDESVPAVTSQEVKLTLPKQESVRWNILRTLPLGRWGIIHRDARSGEGVQLVVARVTADEG